MTTGPLLCLGALAQIGPWIARRAPIEYLLIAASLATAAGTALRGLEGIAPLYAGTVLAGAAIALAQVVLPAWVRTRAPERAGALMGAYSMALTLGATVATFTAIPFERAFGGWGPALALWGLPALAAAALWVPLAKRAHAPVDTPDRAPLWNDRTAWSIALFSAMQSMTFYSVITWLPEILESDGFSEGSAGTLSGVTQLIQAAPAFLIPVLAARRRRQVDLLTLIVSTTLIGVLGVLLVPNAALLWMLILGVGEGGALGLALILPILRGRDAAQVAGMTAMAMGVGYLIAAAGPALVGAVHDVSGGWTWPILALVAMTVAQLPVAWRAVTTP